ncbi:hypothetical protein GGX14DRAFT_572066 [Mycena pura]|uniref:Uncharacterized protein n=1 Tax=Mycena pura TaxID=153505 RepID=A0AAD6Y5H3_9AGAR|nr:hypothetical protein GGX14DRAFT_572066 [Mycena pura]
MRQRLGAPLSAGLQRGAAFDRGADLRLLAPVSAGGYARFPRPFSFSSDAFTNRGSRRGIDPNQQVHPWVPDEQCNLALFPSELDPAGCSRSMSAARRTFAMYRMMACPIRALVESDPR